MGIKVFGYFRDLCGKYPFWDKIDRRWYFVDIKVLGGDAGDGGGRQCVPGPLYRSSEYLIRHMLSMATDNRHSCY